MVAAHGPLSAVQTRPPAELAPDDSSRPLIFAFLLWDLGSLNPGDTTVSNLAACAMLVALVSASQDIVVDAYRIEILAIDEQGIGSSIYILGYRIGRCSSPNAGALHSCRITFSWREIAFTGSWRCLLRSRNTPQPHFWRGTRDRWKMPRSPWTLYDSVIGPLKDFWKRDGVLAILIFVVIYKMGEQMASEMYPVHSSGKSALQKLKSDWRPRSLSALWAMIAGGLIGLGSLLVVWHLYRSLWTAEFSGSCGSFLFSGTRDGGCPPA